MPIHIFPQTLSWQQLGFNICRGLSGILRLSYPYIGTYIDLFPQFSCSGNFCINEKYYLWKKKWQKTLHDRAHSVGPLSYLMHGPQNSFSDSYIYVPNITRPTTYVYIYIYNLFFFLGLEIVSCPIVWDKTTYMCLLPYIRYQYYVYFQVLKLFIKLQFLKCYKSRRSRIYI